jgi:RimJ/RimL family protein N-acetyltransferase
VPPSGRAASFEIRLHRSTLRPWRADDADALARHANEREVWRNMRDAFPYPYTLADARRFIAMASALTPEQLFAIVVDGEAVGGIGVAPMTDVYRRCGEIGYWLAKSHWNRGIVGEAAAAITAYAFDALELVRVQTGVFAWNTASMRVLDKCGYERECVQRRAAFKDGSFVDLVLYAKLRPEPGPVLTA